jgi:hypothetical protein
MVERTVERQGTLYPDERVLAYGAIAILIAAIGAFIGAIFWAA